MRAGVFFDEPGIRFRLHDPLPSSTTKLYREGLAELTRLAGITLPARLGIHYRDRRKLAPGMARRLATGEPDADAGQCAEGLAISVAFSNRASGGKATTSISGNAPQTELLPRRASLTSYQIRRAYHEVLSMAEERR